MQAPPAFQITVGNFGVWRGVLVGLGGAVVLLLMVWGWMAADSARGVSMVAACAGLTLASLASLRALARIQPYSLRWDAQTWWLGHAVQRGHEPEAGHVQVALDFGAWMLLRFTPVAARWPLRNRWLPVQRAGHEAAWHAMRSTVHAARRCAAP